MMGWYRCAACGWTVHAEWGAPALGIPMEHADHILAGVKVYLEPIDPLVELVNDHAR